MKINYLVVALLAFAIIIAALFARTLFMARETDKLLETVKEGDTVSFQASSNWIRHLQDEVREILLESKEKVSKRVENVGDEVEQIDHRFQERKDQLIKENIGRKWSENRDSMIEILDDKSDTIVIDRIVKQLTGITIRYSVYPKGLALTDHLVCDLSSDQILFLVNKDVANEKLVLALQQLSHFTFISNRYGGGTTLFPVFWNSKEVDGKVVGLSLELKLPNGEDFYIMKQKMLSERVVGFSYIPASDTLIVYQ